MSGARTALILVDLQQWIVDMPWSPTTGTDVVKSCVRLRDGFAEADAHTVVLVRHLRADGRDGGAEAPANRLAPALEPRADERLVTKDGLDAFQGTDLREHLNGLAVTRLVLAGLSTAHGVAATAATAVSLGYDVLVVADATASVSEAEHSGALARLARLGVRVGLVEDALPRSVTGG
ncbi:cysteine hydrolase family protein [Streptomyces jumonjinensis]|uniref:cysteine hydrolase family protein n=1 Tax=Streptomyces jumonjinensis TaxID=1945 RepID=UPI00379A5AA9